MSLHEQHMAIVDRPAEYAIIDDGLRILVPSGVYHPHKWSSTRFLMGALPDVRGLDVLEVGGGSEALQPGRWVTIVVPAADTFDLSEMEAQLQNLLPDYGITIQKDAAG